VTLGTGGGNVVVPNVFEENAALKGVGSDHQ